MVKFRLFHALYFRIIHFHSIFTNSNVSDLQIFKNSYGEKMCKHYIGANSSNRKQKQVKNDSV